MKLNKDLKKRTFLIDTGADISLIKRNSLNNDIALDDNICKIMGINDKESYSLGSFRANLDIDNNKFHQELYVINDDFPIQTDGIIGRDFLIKNKCKIDYELFTLHIQSMENEIISPIFTQLPDKEYITIPQRSEYIHHIRIDNTEESLILNQEIQKGIFLANTIIPAKGIKHVKILNTLEEEVTIPLINIQPKISPISDYYLVGGSRLNPTATNRYEQLIEQLH